MGKFFFLLKKILFFKYENVKYFRDFLLNVINL